MFDDNMCYNVPICLQTKNGFSSLEGLTKEQAISQFGKLKVEQSILEFQNVKISKLILIDRLEKAGLFKKAIMIIKSNDLMYERWQASSTVNSSNADVRELLAAIGGDLDVLLAPE